MTPSRPILDQRGYWFANGAYNKSALATEPMSWVPGFHHRTDGRLNYDPDLRTDPSAPHGLRDLSDSPPSPVGGAWNEKDVREGGPRYNRPADEGDFESWFYEDTRIR